MTINIEIQCEDIRELLLHLDVIKEQVVEEQNKLGLGTINEFPDNTTIEDSNCYGEHYITIKEEQQ